MTSTIHISQTRANKLSGWTSSADTLTTEPVTMQQWEFTGQNEFQFQKRLHDTLLCVSLSLNKITDTCNKNYALLHLMSLSKSRTPSCPFYFNAAFTEWSSLPESDLLEYFWSKAARQTFTIGLHIYMLHYTILHHQRVSVTTNHRSTSTHYGCTTH